MAVAYERLIYDGAGLEETNAALLAKTECYKMLGRYQDASGTLARIRMYALTPEERNTVLYQQELCHFLAGELNQAATLVAEVEPSSQDILLLHALVLAYAGRYDESELMAARCISWNGESPHLDELTALYRQHPAERNATAALVLGFLPPLGHFYNGAYGEGLLSAGLNAASVAFVVANCMGGYWVSGILGGIVALNYTWMGSVERSQALTEKNNNNATILFGERLREFLARVMEEPAI
ncbi:MAG: hypothetical protein J5759_05690 [Bacteroidales bacterium]|nr:hypothetical protein [Bacteroidales bacterium]